MKNIFIICLVMASFFTPVPEGPACEEQAGSKQRALAAVFFHDDTTWSQNDEDQESQRPEKKATLEYADVSEDDVGIINQFNLFNDSNHSFQPADSFYLPSLDFVRSLDRPPKRG